MEQKKVPFNKIAFAFIVLLTLTIYQCQKPPVKSNVKILFGDCFGGEAYKITLITDESEVKLGNLHRNEIEPLLANLNQEFSTYKNDSYISKLNNLEINSALETSSFFDKAFEESLVVNKETEGAFDPSVGPLINLWGFGEKKTDLKQITELEVNEAKAKIGLDAFVWQKGSIKKTRPVQLNLSSVIEGMAVDLVAELLDKHGFQNYLIDIGGENLSKGLNANGEPFVVGLEIPNDNNNSADGKFDYTIALKDMSIAASANYKRFYIKDGKRFSHIIDPKSGYPAQNNLACATVIMKNCMRGDTLSTAFMVMGLEKSLAYVNNHPEIDAIFFVRNDKNGFDAVMSNGFSKHLVKKQ